MNSLIIIILSLFSPIMSFPLSLYCLSKSLRDWRAHAFSISMFWASMSYCYNPLSETDLTRYFIYTRGLSQLSFVEAITNVYEGQTNLFVFNAIGWLSERFNDQHFLPALSTFLVYFVALYITLSICEKQNITSKYALIYILFIFCAIDWYGITNNVRNILAFAIVSIGAYRDLCLRKRNLITYLLYLLPIFIHPTAILLVIIRFAVPITSKLKYALLGLVLLVNPIIDFLYSNVRTHVSNFYFNYIVVKMHNYFFDNSSAWGIEVSNSRYYQVNRIVYISMMVAMVVLVLVYDREKRRHSDEISTDIKETNSELIKFQYYLLMLCLMSISCVNMLRPEYWRFSAISVICGASIVVPVITKNNKSHIEKAALAWIVVMAPLCLAMWLYRFQYLDIGDLVSSVFLNSPIVHVIRDLFSFVIL